MRLNEIITEDTLEEGPLGAIGRGVAKGLGGLAKGAGMIAGVGKGLKTAYQKGKATSAAHIGGDVPKQPKQPDPEAQATYDKEYKRLTTPQPQQQQPAAQQQTPQPQATQQQQPAAQQQTTQQQQPAAQQQTPQPQATQEPAAQQQAQEPAAGDQKTQNVDPNTGVPLTPTGRQNMQNRIAKDIAKLSPEQLAQISQQLDALLKAPKASAAADDNPNVVRGSESVQRRGKMIESKQKFMLYTPQTIRIPVNESSRSEKKTASIYRQR